MIEPGNSEMHYLFDTFQVLYWYQYYPNTVFILSSSDPTIRESKILPLGGAGG